MRPILTGGNTPYRFFFIFSPFFLVFFPKNNTHILEELRYFCAKFHNFSMKILEETRVQSLTFLALTESRMKQKYFDCNEHNVIFVKLEKFNTHTKSQRFLALCRQNNSFFSNFLDGANYLKQRQVLQQLQFHISKLNT